MRDGAAALPVAEPFAQAVLDVLGTQQLRQRKGVGPLYSVDQIGKLSLFGRSVCVSDRPECRCLQGWRLRVEVNQVALGEPGGDVAEAAGIEPVP
jgi:hypothetical protein